MRKPPAMRVLSSKSGIHRLIMKPFRRLFSFLRISRALRRGVIVAVVASFLTIGFYAIIWGLAGNLRGDSVASAAERFGFKGGLGWSGGFVRFENDKPSGASLEKNEFKKSERQNRENTVADDERNEEQDEEDEKDEELQEQEAEKNAKEEEEEDENISKSLQVVVLVRGDDTAGKKGLERVLRELSEAKYDGGTVNLRVICSRGRNRPTVRKVTDELDWPHGSKQLVNATRASSGYFSGILSAWNPQRGDNTPVLIIDLHQLLQRAADSESQPSKLISPNYYQYLRSARARYGRRPDVGAYALEPIEVRGRPSILSFSDHSTVTVSRGALNYLYQSAGGVGAIAPFDAETWRIFIRWFEAHRSDWYLWPVIKHEPKSKRDPAWKAFRGNHRAHWTLWWTRFCVEHELFNLYPLGPSPSELPVVSKTAKMENLPRYNHKGVERPEFSGPGSEDLKRIVEKARGKSVAMTVVNDAFVSTARSWVCNVEGADIRPPEILFLTTDQYSYDSMRKVDGAEAVYLQAVKGGGKHGTGTSYGTPGYWLLMLERTQLVSRILNAGIALLAFETDQIWLRDPMPYIRRLVDSGDEVDMVGTLDSYNEIGGNFLYLNPTLATRRLWREIASRFELSFIKNRVARRMRATNLRRRYIENDQSILTKLVFYNETFRRWSPIVFRTLDKELFVDGRWYSKYDKGQLSHLSRSPVMINNNFIVGIPKKRERAIKHGHWFWNDTARVCDMDAVQNAIRANEERRREAHTEEKINADIDVSVNEALGAIG